MTVLVMAHKNFKAGCRVEAVYIRAVHLGSEDWPAESHHFRWKTLWRGE